MSESGDYAPAPHWQGHNFASARRSYVDHADRSYGVAVSKGVVAKDCVPDKLETDCEAPLVIACDVTGSMQAWPATIFSKLPYLEHEGKQYLGEGMRISFAAVGDAFNDKYPVQVQPFVEGGYELKQSLEKLIHEGGGGGTGEESYDLTALYYARNCSMPKAIHKPIFIFIGDEGLYNFIAEDKAADYCHVKLNGRLELADLFNELKKKFSVYVVRKPYGGTVNNPSADEIKIRKQWISLLGEDHVIGLPEAERVVDVIFGILGVETGRFTDFEKELEDRQGKDSDGDHKIAVVKAALKTIRTKTVGKLPSPQTARSVTKRPKGDKSGKSISLLDD